MQANVVVTSSCALLLLSVAACQQPGTGAVGKADAPLPIARPVQTASTAEPSAFAKPSTTATVPVSFPGLKQVVAYHEGFYSGAQPDGEQAFASLAKLGVKTVISVDGATPDVAGAEKHGLRYIHLPITYSGFDETRRWELARATSDAMLQGDVYLHCHHGKHRSAGACGNVAVSLGWATPQAMIERMKVSGTAPTYTGLWERTRTADALSPQQLASVKADFPSVSPPGTFVQSMVELDAIAEHFGFIKNAGWASPPEHPDLVPAAEAGRAADILRHLATKADGRKKDDFAARMHASQQAAQTLEDMLVAGEPAEKLATQHGIFVQSCKDCHVKYRD